MYERERWGLVTLCQTRHNFPIIVKAFSPLLIHQYDLPGLRKQRGKVLILEMRQLKPAMWWWRL